MPSISGSLYRAPLHHQKATGEENRRMDNNSTKVLIHDATEAVFPILEVQLLETSWSTKTNSKAVIDGPWFVF